MWNILTHLFTFTGGMAAGVTLMCYVFGNGIGCE
ncbi:DUF3789 domain-containing protein [Extibacter muris]|uniref:DUF3789 domain-containing protein n=1 Tax=Extibacter muris TaxID=1796622 RepID=A0A4R4FLS1_9FIRM|nr:DUF3789 domain-containing protein [Extibacter muris]